MKPDIILKVAHMIQEKLVLKAIKWYMQLEDNSQKWTTHQINDTEILLQQTVC